MPAVHVQTNGRTDGPEAAESPEAADMPDRDDEETPPSVNDYLEMALAAAAESAMSTSELLGIFYYYTHSIAESYRQEAVGQAG